MKRIKNSFIKYFMMALAFTLVSMLFASCDVKANVSPYLEGVQFPINYSIYNNQSASTATNITNTSSRLCESNRDGFYDICYISWQGFLGTYGNNVTFQTSDAFINGYNYSATLFFASNTSTPIFGTDYSSYNTKIGTGSGWAARNQPASILASTPNSCIDLGEKYNIHVFGYRYLCSFTDVFKSNSSGSYLSVSFSASNHNFTIDDQGSFAFLGYVVSSQGSSTLTQSEIRSALTQDFNTLNQNINNFNQTQQETNKKLDDLKDNQDKNTQDVIDNQNKNNQELQDKLDEEFQTCVDSVNLFNANNIQNDKIKVSDNGRTLLLPVFTSGNGYLSTNSTLRELAPTLQVGDVVYLYFKQNLKSNNYIYLTSTWNNGTKRTISQEDLDSIVVFYGNRFSSGETDQKIITDFMITKEYTSTWYPYSTEKICTNKIDETNEKLDDLNNNLTSTDTSGAEGAAGGFFDNFDDNDYGLSDVITMPLELIKKITNTSCTPLVLPIPFVNTNVTLPCMNTIYSQFFGNILTLYQTITTGMIAYWICINIFGMVKGFKDPDKDNVEVMEL